MLDRLRERRVKMLRKMFVVPVLLGVFLLAAGCGCFRQAMKGEVAPPRPSEVVKVTPEEKKEEVVVKKEVPEVSPLEKKVPVPGAAPSAPPEGIVSLQDIHFDFDRYNIRPQDAEILKKNLEWFKRNPNEKVRIEGHCDERGTIEYNLVLGQKRADAAKSFLVDLGVREELLETISYGKERPIDPRHNEEAWARNRRAHFEPLK
jgi:peptidoglycan-associated lipoprotein